MNKFQITPDILAKSLADLQNMLLVSYAETEFTKRITYNVFTMDYQTVACFRGIDTIYYTGKSQALACETFNTALPPT